MDLNKISENITVGCDKLGEFNMLGHNLEDIDPRALDVREDNLDEHVAMQPAAVAYFGVLKQHSKRMVENLKDDFSRWEKRTLATVKKNMTATGNKATIKEVENQYEIDHESDIQGQVNKIREAQTVADDCDSYYEAWKQKGFSLKVYADLYKEEIFTNPYLKDNSNETPVKRGRMSPSERKKEMQENN